MDLILRPSGGRNIVLRPQAREPWQPDATVDPHEVEVFWQEVDATGQALGTPISLGRHAPDAKVTIPYNPTSDKNVRVFARALSASGVPDVPELRLATQATVIFSRESDAPVVTLIGNATNTLVALQVTGFTRFATKRRVRRSPNADMSGATEVVTDYTGMEMPIVVNLTRAADPSAATEYVAIAHSSGGGFGAESAPLAVTFADSGGAGGSTGGGGTFYPFDEY
jgi:hypothetical protein